VLSPKITWYWDADQLYCWILDPVLRRMERRRARGLGLITQATLYSDCWSKGYIRVSPGLQQGSGWQFNLEANVEACFVQLSTKYWSRQTYSDLAVTSTLSGLRGIYPGVTTGSIWFRFNAGDQRRQHETRDTENCGLSCPLAGRLVG